MNGKLYALMLEDVPKDAELLKEMLTDEGFDMQIDVVDTEAAYTSCLKSHNYDIIYADFTLPSFNGQEALELAKIICPYVPFICISGTIGEDRAVELLKQGATDYVLKDRMERLPFATKRALDAAVQLSKFRKTEIELQTNRRLLQTIINNASDAIYIKDIQGNYLLINEASAKAVNKTSPEVIGKDDTFFFSASEAQMIMGLDKKVIESGVSQTFEERVTLADGNIHTFSVIKSPMFDDFGKPTGLFGIARDITERKKAEEAIRQERVLLRTLIDNLPDAIYVKDDKGRKLVANSVDLKIMNYASEAEIIGKTDLEIFDTEVGSGGYSEDMSVLQTGQPLINHEDYFIDTAGVKHWRLTSKIPLFNEQQKVIGLVGVGRDITERKKSVEALQESERKHRIVADNTYDWEFWLDPQGQFIYCSPSCFRVTGHKVAEFMADPDLLNKIIHPDDQADYTIHMRETETSYQPGEFNFRIIRPDGTERWIGHICQPVLDENGISMGRRGSNRDITEHRKSEEQLIIAKEKAEESDRLKTAFLHNISHEIRTPMNAIIGFSSFLGDPDLVPEKRKQFTDIIIQSSDQLLSIITDIINIASIEAGQEKIIQKELDLNLTLRQLHEQFLVVAKKKDISLNLVTSPTNIEDKILTDGTKFVQILSNLVVNALKFTKQGHVNFGYTLKNTIIEFFIEDTGIGIPGEMLNEIFKRFRQVESGTSRQFGGSGLGLSISKAYVELLGGRIWVNSELGKGSTFYFTIPYKKVQKEIKSGGSNKEPEKVTKQIKTILIAEDEDSNFMLLKELLSDLNANIIRAINGLEAVDICKTNKQIDVVLMDIKMPLVDGYEATRKIRAFMPGLPIIAQTAYTTDADKNKAFACGCNDFISKPFNRGMLIAKMKEQLYKE